MARFLVRSFSDPKGYEVLLTQGAVLPRSRQESYVPWAVTIATSEVVYARTGEHVGFRGGGDAGGAALRPYDHQVSQNRRREAESRLGMAALDNPSLTKDAVDLVSSTIKRFLVRKAWDGNFGLPDLVYKQIGHYFFTDRNGFGRLSDTSSKQVDAKKVWIAILEALDSGRVDQKMSLHDAIGRKILSGFPGAEKRRYDELGPIVRQDWFDDADKRGRVDAPQRARPTQQAGTSALGSAQPSRTAIPRVRGVDSFRRDMHRVKDVRSNAYYDDVDERNLLFGAGISGTTGTLLQAARAFGNINSGELLKQYVLAIIGYLVGGGMHSAHESFAVAAKAGLPYQPGTFIHSLPASFLNSRAYAVWAREYYDIVILGGIHWMKNETHLPSHLNPLLRNA